MFTNFLCRTVFEQQLVKVRDFERSTNVQLEIKFFFFNFSKIYPDYFEAFFKDFQISFGRN